nr:hypothetical protein [Tanacetum cinerariifolium]
MDNKKRIVNLEYFREMLHICSRLPNQTFDKLLFKEEILAFFRYLGHSREIRKLTDFNINKLHQPWRSFAPVINKCLGGKSTSYDSLWLSQPQILWGMYHKKNVYFAYLMWEGFVCQVKHKDAKKSNEMYYPRFTKVIIHFFMTKDPLILRRNKVNWHYVRDDQMFTMIKLVSRHQNTQQFGVMLPVELTNEDIRNSEAYKEYYDIASGAAPPKTKASVRKTKSSSETTITPPTAVETRLSTSVKGKQPAKSSKAKGIYVLSEVAVTEAEQMKLATKRSLQQTHISQASGSGADEGTGIILGVPHVPTDESDEEISWKSSDEDDDDEVDDKSDDQEDDDDDDQDDDDQDDNDDDQDTDNDGDNFVMMMPIFCLNVDGEEGQDAEDNDEELYRDVNINLEGRDVQMANVHTTQEFEDTRVTLTLVNPDGQQQSSSVSSQFVTSMLRPIPDACIDSLFETTPWVDVQASTTVGPLTLTAPTLPPPTIPTISEFVGAVSSILGIVERYMDQWMNKAVKTSCAVAAYLSEIELKKILIEKMESNKSIHRSDEQKNLYKALVDAYECDKIILDTYGDTVTLKRRRDDADKHEEPSAGSDRGSKRRSEGKETESTSAPKGKATKTTGKSTEGSKSHQKNASEFAPAEEPIQTTKDLEEPSHQEFETGVADDQPIVEASQHPKWFQIQKKPPTPDRAWNKTLPATHGSIQPWISDLAKQADSRSSFNELMDTHVDFSAFLMNRLKVDTLTPELLAGPTYELMKGSCKSLVELKFFLEEVYKATTYQLDWNNPKGQQYLHNLLKPLPLIPNSRGRRVIPFNHFINNDLEYLRGGASSRKYTTFVTKTKAADYGHIK